MQTESNNKNLMEAIRSAEFFEQDHLAIAAAYCHRLGLVDLIDERIPCKDNAEVTSGEVVLAMVLGLEVSALGEHGAVTALDGFLRADALSALVIGLTAFVALACAIYAVGYFRRDLSEGRITELQLRHYYVQAPERLLMSDTR